MPARGVANARQVERRVLTDAEADKATEVLVVLLEHLPLDLRARVACVCRAWRAAASNPELWMELRFAHCTARVDNAALSALSARAGASLRELHLDATACEHVTAAGLVVALRSAGCTGLQRLCAPVPVLTPALAQQLAAACPALQHAACTVSCELSQAAAVVPVLPGQVLHCREDRSGNSGAQVDLKPLATLLSSSPALASLSLTNSRFGDGGVDRLAAILRNCTSLTSLRLGYLGNAGSERGELTEFCVITTLHSRPWSCATFSMRATVTLLSTSTFLQRTWQRAARWRFCAFQEVASAMRASRSWPLLCGSIGRSRGWT